MFTGKLDRYVTLESNTPSADGYGEPIESWSTIANVYAEKMNPKAVERYVNYQDAGFKNHVWRIRWRSDVDNLDRLVHNSENYNIIGVTEVGRKHYLLLMTELII